MLILQLCHKPPVPAVDGGCIAMAAASKALMQSGHQVKILAIETPKHPFLKRETDREFIRNTAMEAYFVDTSIKFLHAFFNLFTSKSYNITRFYSRGFKKKLIETLQSQPFELVQLESLFVAPYISTIRNYAPGAKIVLRAHNLEHLIWSRASANTGFFKSAYLKLLASRLKKYELGVFRKVDGIIAISEDDAGKIREFGTEGPVASIPVNVDVEEVEKASDNSLFYIGSFDWLPNSIGVKWFLKEVWPEVGKPGKITFNIAGRKMYQHINPQSFPGVVAHGEVPDSRNFMKGYGIMVVPLFSGSGIRVKILEAMALGKTVISTSIGAEGLGARPGKEILIADTAREFVGAINKCINNPVFAAEIGQNAMGFVRENFSTLNLGERFSQFFEQIKG